MYETLKALSIRLDSPAQSLTKDAIAQLLIKIVYANQNSMTRNQILDKYKSIVGWDDAKRDEINKILDSLKNTEIQFNKGQFYLSSAKRNEIDTIRTISETRFQYIIDSYFKPFFSSNEAIKNWLQDAFITFFSSYSREWIADLCSNQNAVLNSIPNIIEQISRRTISNKEICKEDREHLINSFQTVLTVNDTEMDSILWEYGTAQFASQLIKNGNNIDKLAVDTFTNAVCILDTNILFHLSLPGTEYSKHLNSIEKIFNSLGITVRYLYITKEEYINTVSSKTTEVLKLLDTFTPEVVSEADNQLVQAAKQLHCNSKEDFERFFKTIITPPTVIDNTIKVSLLDDDKGLNAAITEAQGNEEKKTTLNSAHRSFTGHDKREHALIHDVGLIAGADYLRRNGTKIFILSQDSSIINYAKQYPFFHDLPIAIKIETLLNVLAVNSYNNSTENYQSLFASIIRQGLQPKSTTFKVEDLHYIMEKEQFVSQLPNESVISIVNEVSRRRLLGEDDETINKELIRKVQGEKLKVATELQSTRLLLTASQHQAQQLSKDNIAGKKALIDKLTKEKNGEISKKISRQYLYGILSVIGISAIIAGVVIAKQYFMDNENLWQTIGVAVVTDIGSSVWAILKGFFPKIKELKETREHEVEEYVAKEIEKIYG